MSRAAAVLGLCVIMLAAAGAYVLFYSPLHMPGVGDSGQSGNSLPAAQPQAARQTPAGFAEYLSPQYHFSLFYPLRLTAQTYTDDAGKTTIIFQDTGTAEGFQIFVSPYAADQIGEERFKQDIPSGVRTDPKDVAIDGAKAVSFYSSDSTLGETAEVWFIKGGYLYEVTTLKPLAPWLSELMATWHWL